jgi:cobalt-zinc-cadmium efflux system membrane fusion protein
VVFVRTGDGLYEPRQVEIGRANGSLVQVIGSIRPGSSVVTDGAFLLKTELSKENIGAGCCEVEPPRED